MWTNLGLTLDELEKETTKTWANLPADENERKAWLMARYKDKGNGVTGASANIKKGSL